MQELRFTPNEYLVCEARRLYIPGKFMKYDTIWLTNKRIMAVGYGGDKRVEKYTSIPLDQILIENGKPCIDFTPVSALEKNGNTIVIHCKDGTVTIENYKLKAELIYIFVDLLNYLAAGYFSNFSDVDAASSIEKLEKIAFAPKEPFAFPRTQETYYKL